MESTHDREIIHALRHKARPDSQSFETGSLLSKEKEILKHPYHPQVFAGQKSHLQGLTSVEHCFDKFGTFPPSTADLIAGNESVFYPSKTKTIEEDESVVSSTTNEIKAERSPKSPVDSAFDSQSARHRLKKANHQQYASHVNNITETAAASSTTTLDDDEERLQMQETSERGRRAPHGIETRPPSCGTPLGSIKESQPSSTTRAGTYAQGKATSSRGNPKGQEEFLKPLDVAAKPKSHRSSSNSRARAAGHPFESDDVARDEGAPPNPLPGSAAGDPPKDGGYQFDPRQISLRGLGMNRSPILSDISLIPLSPQPMSNMSAPNPLNPNSSLDFYMGGGFSSPTMSMLSQARNLSPRHSMQDLEKMNQTLYGHPFNVGQTPPGAQGHMPPFPSGFPPQGVNWAYYQLAMQQHHQKLLAMSQEEYGRFPSPMCRSRARKRPLSISPAFSDSIDINNMIRNSPNSLLPYVNGSGLGHSRCSSAASGGSYGHLAAGGISPSGYMSGYNTPTLTAPQLQFFSRQMSVPGYMPGAPGSQQLAMALDNVDPAIPNPFQSIGSGTQRNFSHQPGLQMPERNPNNPQAQTGIEIKSMAQQRMDSSNHPAQYSNATNNNNAGVSPGTTNDDETVYETNCEWDGCNEEFDSQEQLVQHINNDHIHGDKKEFACHWKDCAREKRPFKAQYMLVVHMRRHTGEKPHKCTFKGCMKAYSRLENLKTHLRSHTGEKPYVCEFPSCTKAFSNASDRAKHQNRTHSNEKPYVCKITGCTKRYTDPSSLRKHVKTVHGPEAHVTKRMKATREREERKTEITVKQEPGVDKTKKKTENDNTRLNCNPSMHPNNNNQPNDQNPPGSMNPRSNQSSYTSGSDVTPHNSPHMTSQNNNDSGVDVNVGGNDGDSDGDIVVDENPLPDSTSGGVSVQARVRTNVRPSMVPRHFSKKMATLSLREPSGDMGGAFGDFPAHPVEEPCVMNERNMKQVSGPEVSSTTLSSKLQRVKNYLMNNSVMKHRQMSLINQDRRDSGTVSDVSRKSSSASQASRKSSQISAVGINVAGSYDPISLDSSRRSSSNSAAPGLKYPAAGSNAPSLHPYDLHHLQSKFSEVAGLPPPTPINGESGSKHHSRSFAPDNRQLEGGQRGNNFQHRPAPFLPTPPRSMRSEQATRRRSEEVYLRSVRTPQPEVMGPSNRRASDPVPKTTQIDPNSLPSVQRHGSWNSMAPLPDIQNRNNHPVQSPRYDEGSQMMQTAPTHLRSNSVGNFFVQEQQQQQQHHLANFNQHSFQPHNGANEQLLVNNSSANAMASYQPDMEHMYRQRNNYGDVISSASNVFATQGHAMTQHGNEFTQSRNNVNTNHQYPPMMTYHNESQHQPMGSPHVVAGQQEPPRFYNNQKMQMSPNHAYNPHAQAGHVLSQQPYPVQQQPMVNSAQQPANNFPYNHQVDGYAAYESQIQMAQLRNASLRAQNQQHCVPQTSIQQSRSAYPNPIAPSEQTLTPRPPSNSSSSYSNRLRLARLRHNSAQAADQEGLGSGSYGRPNPRVNYTPDAQIPDDFLQQEFIDSIPELQPDSINNVINTEPPSYVKMPADSTTGPDGGAGDDNDDVMSMTNTDVTLPPMSAFSSRLATPLMNKPFPPQHPLAGASQHPASNMAISSMSSMLSTLEEENKYLSLMPPQ